jgi:Rrf2 family iron-sulfur cluster assembly transcriptional regulator
MQLIPLSWMSITEAVTSIALQPGNAPLRASVLADKLGLAPRHLEARLQKLVHAGLLRSIRGPRGGYVLARERRQIRLLDIVAAAEGLSDHALHAAVRTSITPPDASAGAAALVLAPAWQEMAERMLYQLQRLTLEDLCSSALQRRLVAPGALPQRIDYAI